MNVRRLKSRVREHLRAVAAPALAWLHSTRKIHSFDDETVSQQVLVAQYRALAASGIRPLPSLRDVGFRKYSQFEEDGILLYLFAVIGASDRRCLEICAGNALECNTTNLIVNHGWQGVLFDGNEANARIGRRFFAHHPSTFLEPPVFETAWITAENVDDLVAKTGLRGKIDLLCLDIDGMDYWVWKALTVVDPVVVLCEVHNPIPPDRALVAPYDPQFEYESEDHRGASLLAMCKLGREKGYRLVGAHRYGFNAFFVKNGVADEALPEVDVASCQGDLWSARARRERWPRAQRFPWQEV